MILRIVWLTLVVVGLMLIELCEGSKILIIHPLYCGSHVLTLKSVAESLVSRNHSVHTIRWKDESEVPFSSSSNPNLTLTTLAMNNSEGQYAYLTKEPVASFQVPFDILWSSGLTAKSILESYRAFPLMGAHCDTLLSNTQLRKELNESKFDLAIIDIIYNECSLALINDLKIPVVGYWAFPYASGEADYSTAFLPPSHIPAFLSKLSHEMSFIERTYNLLMKLMSHFIMLTHTTIVNNVIQRHLPNSPHPIQLLRNINGMLINTDYSLDYPRLLPPTYINVGAMQIKKPKPLPKEISDWIESSGEHGIVLFTMGFIFKPQIVPKRLINAFMTAFSRLPQKVLMKFEGEIEYVPKNVKVLNWIPQQDVLAHPKTRVFLTHCGLHGVMEGIYYQVPMVGMPIFIDQGDVLIKMNEKGISLGFDKRNASADEIYEKLYEVIYNPKYKENVKKLSALMRDTVELPLERVLNFLEFMIRTKGAEHLKLKSSELNFIQYFSIDTISIILLLVSIIIYLQFILLKYLIKKLLIYTSLKNNKMKVN